LITTPLAVFLLLSVGTVLGALALRVERPALEGAIERLADGDLDRSERDQMLSRVVALGESSERLRGRWAAALAAVALQDRAAFDRAESRLGGGDRIVPAPQQLWLSLGDSLLANLFAAMQAEAAQDRSAATEKWGQVAVQARYTGNAVAAKLAEEARLRIE
jgi:hypothetical protein